MGEKNNDQSIMDKSMRSVFVGNIPYEATEEKLKEIFSEVGPVLSLKLVFDRESGKPKGYGFCEYKDQETALSAMRNLNGYEIGGRTLRVDNACTEKSRMEMQQLLQGPQVENPYGEHCDPELAPETITKTVASLPPEQMYELMKQMKLCIQNNPAEARQMLLMNPQLSYALLQSMVVMRIVDPQTAVTMLFRANQMPPVITNNSAMIAPPINPPVNAAINPMGMPNHFPVSQDVDLRSMDPRLNRNMDMDMRSVGNSNMMEPPFVNRPPANPSRPPMGVAAPFQSDPRQRGDPRMKPQQTSQALPQQQPPSAPSSSSSSSNRIPNVVPTGIPNDATDNEKAQLIMQVLQLSEEQIAMLSPEQQASIHVLKEQIAKSTPR